jgi:hypothetical protein
MRAKHFDTSAHEAHNAYGVHGHAYLIGQGFDRSAGVDLTATIGCSTSISHDGVRHDAGVERREV